MNIELKELAMAALRGEGLPLGYARILTSDSVIDDETTRRVTLELAKYRHSVMYIGRAGKPISKLEL